MVIRYILSMKHMTSLMVIAAWVAGCLFAAPALQAQRYSPLDPSREGYLRTVFTAPDGTALPVRYLEPQNAKPGKKYPLVVFLHGAGERGADNEKQLVHGSGQFLNPVNRAKYPAYVVFPQCPEETSWAYERLSLRQPSGMPAADPETALMKAVKALIDSYVDAGKVDPRRIYVMGLSMGGMATFDLLARYPDLFAAAIPICGTVNPARLGKVGAAVRIFHGDADPTVPVAGSREAYKALLAAGSKVEYFEIPGCGHDSWTLAFRRDDFLSWLFSQKKRR